MENDSIFAGPGNDLIMGEGNSDTIRGDLGDDTIFGGWGFDWISGGYGGDVLNGGAGSDVLSGGPGDDTFVFDSFDARLDTVLDFDVGHDEIHLALGNLDFEEMSLAVNRHGVYSTIVEVSSHQSSVAKIVLENVAPEEIWLHGVLDDYLPSLIGTLRGTSVKDDLTGGTGNDTVLGYQGDDYIEAGDGNDEIFAGFGPRYDLRRGRSRYHLRWRR